MGGQKSRKNEVLHVEIVIVALKKAFLMLFVPDIDSPDKYLSNDVLPGGASKSAHPSEGHCGLILAPTGDNFFPLKA